MKDQAERLRSLAGKSRKAPEPLPEGAGRVIAVASGKGGVGKTSVVANLGAALARRGRRVLALDADFGLANLDILLNLRAGKNLGHLLRGEATAEEIVQEAAPGFSVLPGASGVERLADLDAADRERVLSGLFRVAEGFDYVLIDTAAGIGRNVTELCLAAREVLLVTDPEPTSLTDAYGLSKILFAQSADVALRLVVNSASGEAEGRAVGEKLNQVMGRFLQREIPYLGHIAQDPFVSKATARQTPFVLAYPRCPAALCVEKLAGELEGAAPGTRSGVGGFWNRLTAGHAEAS